MHEVFKIFVLSTIVITLWTAFLLLQDKRGNKLLNRWFALFLVTLTLPQMDLYANQVVQGGIPKLALLASTFLWLKGPFVWTFVRVLIHKETGTSKAWLHFLPWFSMLISTFTFPQYLMTFVFMGMAHMMGYLLMSSWRLTSMRRYVIDIWQGFQGSSYYWLLYVIGGLMALVFVDFVVMSMVARGILNNYDLLDYIAFPVFSTYVFSVGILSVYRPELLFRSSNHELELTSSPEHSSHNTFIEGNPANDVKERHLELDDSLAQSLMQQLTRLVEVEQVYRQNELSLSDLADQLNISVHQLSELLNVHQGVSFYDFINGYRLRYACGLLSDPSCCLRILDIAFEAGFNNKNSFYRTFKDVLGITPHQYRLNRSQENHTPVISV